MPATARRSEGLVVALDGPGSSGKSSVGAAAARELGYRFFDTGLLYRAITWLALDRGVGSHDSDALVDLVEELELAEDDDGHLNRVLSDGRDVTDAVRGPEVDANVSEISAIAPLRAALLERQRALAANGRIVMAGRDIGTVVLPDADLKLYLDASVEERAMRRARERNLDPDGPEAEHVLEALRRRDRLDTRAGGRSAPGGTRRQDPHDRRQRVRGHGGHGGGRHSRRRGARRRRGHAARHRPMTGSRADRVVSQAGRRRARAGRAHRNPGVHARAGRGRHRRHPG